MNDIIVQSLHRVVDRACALIDSGEMQFSCTALKLAVVLEHPDGAEANLDVGNILVELYTKSTTIYIGRNAFMPNWWEDNTASEENKQARIAALKHFKSSLVQ
jgi:hypothetical protein